MVKYHAASKPALARCLPESETHDLNYADGVFVCAKCEQSHENAAVLRGLVCVPRPPFRDLVRGMYAGGWGT